MRAVRYHPAARVELREAVRFGEAQQLGRGALFEAAVYHVERRIRRLPQSAPLWIGLPYFSELRRARVRRYPYLLVYVVLPESLVVVAVAHTSLPPGYWAERIGGLVR